ncbi:hypothetical protein SNE40_020018 [Patella caerulea]|uniref:Uncharacterized protein n=1 Tax=Patella caerulea TaxID=87958 RepID=A0AAN8GDB6_PATCE
MSCIETNHAERISYTASELYSLRPGFKSSSLSGTDLNRIPIFGIQRCYRGNRGKQFSARRTAGWKASWDKNKGIHFDLLRSLRPETLYDNNHHCRFGLVNARPIRNKTDQFVHHVVSGYNESLQDVLNNHAPI